MDIMALIYYLRKILPNVDLISNENRTIITDSNISNEEKVIRILLNYFNDQKTKYIDDRLLETEADYINKLFPMSSKNDILNQLQLFKDMPHRVEIVLRIIVQSKIYKNNSNIHGVKRTSPTHFGQISNNLNNYCHPIKIRKVKNGFKSTYSVVDADPKLKKMKMPVSTSHLDNYSNNPTHTIVKNNVVPNISKVKSCTITSVDAIPQVQEVTNKKVAKCSVVNVGFPEKYIVNTKQSCDSSSYIKEDNSFLVQNSSVVSSSDEVTHSLKTEEHDSNSESAILEKKFADLTEPRDSINEQDVNLEAVDESSLPIVAENCTVNSSNDTENMIKESMYLDFYSELEFGDQNKESMYVSDSTSHRNEIIPLVEPETKDEGFVENNVSETSTATAEKPKVVVPEELTDSDKTMLYSPLNLYSPINQLYDEEMPINNYIVGNENNVVEEMPSVNNFDNQDIILDKATVVNDVFEREEMMENSDSNETNGQYFKDIPSTSKQPPHDNMSEPFDLIAYLHEVTNATVNIIQKQCKKFNVPTWTKPNISLLAIIVDNLLTNKISSESSDGSDDEYDDPDAVELVCNHPPSVSVRPIQLEPVLNNSNVVNIINPPVPEITQQVENVKMESKKDVEDLTKSNKIVNVKSANSSGRINTQLVNYLCGIFPDACPDYIRGLCKNKPMNNEVVDDLTTSILNTNGQYPKRPVVPQEPEVYPENQLDILKEFLPEADPDYLRMMCDRFEGKPDLVKAFLNEAMERKNYPTIKDYQRRQQLSAQQKQYTTDFNVENFIKVIPDPHKFFSDSSRVVAMDPLSAHYALVFLRNTFCRLTVRVIQSTFTKNNSNLSKTYAELKNIMSQNNFLMKSRRRPMEMPNSIQNIPLLQEIAYFTHQEEINEYLQKIKEKEEAERLEALNNGLMKTCNCCYFEEVLPKDIFTCESGCEFCKSCIVKFTEVRFGEGKLDFPCLMDCSSHFSLQTLQAVLSPKLFSKIAQKKALEEIKAAGIEELEMCPFCDFATIPAEGYSIFSCLNPECMKESCRFCKEPSHIPLRCEEIEKDEDVKARKFVEDKMTEALVKKCYKCGIKFFKEEGCNKMTCSCGATMCYYCGKPVTDYKHFNGTGGDRFDLCPLYSDTNQLNKENVLKAAEQAKAALGNRSLVHDPTKDVDQYYKERAKKFPQQQLLVQQQREAEVFLVRMRNVIDHLDRRRRPHNPF